MAEIKATISQTIGLFFFQLTEPSFGKLHERFISFKRAGNKEKLSQVSNGNLENTCALNKNWNTPIEFVAF